MVMLTLAEIKDPKGYYDGVSISLRFGSIDYISLLFTCNYDIIARQVSSQCPKYQAWVQVICEH